MSADTVSSDCIVNVRTIESGSFTVPVPSDQGGVVGVIKAKLEELTGVPANRQRLLHRGRELVANDGDSAQSLGWGENVVLHMVTQSAPGSQPRRQAQGVPAPAAGMPPGEIPQSITDMLNALAGAAGGRMTVGQISDTGDFGRMMSQMMSGDGIVSEPIGGTLLSGRVPPLNDDGTLRLGCTYDALYRMLRRLEDNNQDEDEVPARQETTLEMFRNEQHSRAFAAAVTSFLSASREILRGSTLNRETREVVNRALRAARQGTLPLGVEVESFPVDDMGEDRDENDYSWLRNVSHEDLIIVSAVTVGELARRYLAIVDGHDSPSGTNATIGRLAERLRSMSSVTNQEETIAQIRLVVGHLSRVAVAGAELGRSMAYLMSALENNNMFFLQLYPGYIEVQNGTARPHLGILHNMEAHRVVSVMPDILPGMPPTGSIAGIMSVQVPLPMGTATNESDGGTQRQEGTHEGDGNDASNTQGNEAPNTQGNAPPFRVEGILRSIPQVEQILNTLGGAEAGQNLSGIFSSALRNVAASNVTIDQIINDVKEAITQGLSAAASQIRSLNTDSTPSLDQMISTAVPEITNRVGDVLRTRITTVINAAGAGNTNTSAEPAPATATEQAPPTSAEPTPPADPVQTGAPPAVAVSTDQRTEMPIDNAEKGGEERPEASAPKKAGKPVMGLGGGLKKRKAHEKVGGSGGPSLPARPSKPSTGSPAPSASSMQNILGQVMGGSSAGGGMDFGALLNSAGPLLGQMMGGGSGRSRGQDAPIDIDEILERDVPSSEERAQWRQHLFQQRPQPSPAGDESLSDTYFASIPPQSGGNGFLDGIL